MPVLLGLAVAHVLARDRGWVHEWVWAHYQYAFVTVLLGPLAAGTAAVDGVRLARTRSLLGTTDRTLSALVAAWVGASVWVLTAYAAGLALVVGLVKAAGTPGWPTSAALLTSLPAAALLVAETAAGVAVGWWGRHLLAAPVVATGCFLTTLWLYESGPGELVVVGGATASLVDLTPRLSLQLLQIVWFAAISAGLLVAASRLTGWGARRGSWRLPVAGGLCAVALVPLLGQGETFLVRTNETQVCSGVAPTVCVAHGYAAHGAATRAALLPYVDAMRSLGVSVPSTFRQGAEPGHRDVGAIDAGLVLGDRSQALFAVLGSYLSKSCPIQDDVRVQTAFTGLVAWLQATVDGQRTPDPTVPPIVLGPRTPAQVAWLRAAVQTLTHCAD